MEVIARGQITIWNYKDGDDAYSIILNHDTHAVACDPSGNALSGELGPSGKAVFALSAYKGATKLTMRYSTATSATGICSWKIGTVSGCTAAQVSGSNEKFYINTMTADSGYVEIVCSVDGKISVTKKITIVKQKKGATGPTGKQGCMLRPRGLWTAQTQYVYNDQYRDVVLYDNDFKIAKSSHTSGSTFDSTKWEDFNEFINIATSVLLANTGFIKVLGAGKIFIGQTDSGNGWEMTGGAIKHTKTSLELTADGKLKAPSGLSIIAGSKTLNDYILNSKSEYAVSTSETEPPTEGWSTTTPERTDNKYIWTRITTTYGSGKIETSEPVCLSGTNGKDGKGIKNTTVTYQASTSGTSVPSGTWNSTIPSVAANQYLWTRTIITYTDNSTSTSYCVGKMGATGAKGETGATGPAGADGDGIVSITNTYQIGTSGTTAPTGTWSTSIPSPQKGKYLWTKTVTTYKKSGTTTAYSVSYYGTDGTNASYITVSGEQIFKYTNNFTGTPSPSSIALTATAVGTSGYQWSFRQAGQTAFTNISGATSSTYTLTHNNSTIWGSAKSVTIRCTSGGKYDEITIAKVSDGAKGDKGDQGLQGAKGDKGESGAIAKLISGITDLNVMKSSSYEGRWYAGGSNGITNKPSGVDAFGLDVTRVASGWYSKILTSSNTSTNKMFIRYWNSKSWTSWVEKGKDGKDGIPGEAGSDGKTSYLHIAYANSADGSSGFSTTDAVNKLYIGQYTDFIQADSSDYKKYTWSKFKGDKGDRGIQGLQGEKGEQGIQGPKGDTGATGASGKTSYFHIKYSDVSNPTSSSQMTETPSTYIGTYVDFVQTDSTDPTKYTWTRFKGIQGEKGEQGIPGKNGSNGQTSYLHIAYANSSDGSSGFSTTDSTNKLYIGQYTDFTQADSSDYKKYSWSKIKGETGAKGDKGDKGDTGATGKGIKSVVNHYLASTASSGVTASTSGWTTTIQTITESKKYLWNYETITYTDNSSTSSSPCIIGVYGNKGATGNTGAAGKGIKSITEHYAVSSSNTTAPTNWSTSLVNTTTTNKYLWNYETITYTDGSTEDTTKRVIGTHGATGSAGAAGKDAYTVLLTNESHTFAGTTSAAIASSAKCTVIAYKGATQVAATIGTPTGMPTGMTHAITNNGSTTAYITFSVSASMTTSSGIVNIPISVDGKSFTKQFSYSISFKGSTGATGASAVVYSIEPSVNVITKSLKDVISPTSITCKKYKTTGNSARVETTEKTLKYQRFGVDSTEQTYTNAVTITNATTSVVFSLYNGSTLLDKATVPVLFSASEIKSELNVLSTQIEAKVNQTEFDSLGKTVSTHTTQITQNANSIKSTNTTVSGLSTKVSTIEQDVDNISLKVKTLWPDNIFPDGDFEMGGKANQNVSNCTSTIDTATHMFNSRCLKLACKTSGNSWIYLGRGQVPVKAGQTYTVIFWIRGTSSFRESGGACGAFFSKDSELTLAGFTAFQPAITTSWVRLSYKLTAPAESKYLALRLGVTGQSVARTLYFDGIMVFEGDLSKNLPDTFVPGNNNNLLATGIDVYNNKITVTADQFLVQNNKGETTAKVNTDGILETNGGIFNGLIKRKAIELTSSNDQDYVKQSTSSTFPGVKYASILDMGGFAIKKQGATIGQLYFPGYGGLANDNFGDTDNDDKLLQLLGLLGNKVIFINRTTGTQQVAYVDSDGYLSSSKSIGPNKMAVGELIINSNPSGSTSSKPTVIGWNISVHNL